ncbi:TerB family tellurite resistance protein [Haliangium ochraceum]|nr:TerB family tellurite resistance protein [Haliangium ochraceum]
MSQSTYEAIQPLIAHSEQQGTSMRVIFRCPASGEEVEATAGLRSGNDLGNRVAQSAKRSLMWSVRSAIASAVRSAFGHGIVSNMAQSATRDAMSAGQQRLTYSDSDKRDAIERAFESVSSQFVWDSEQSRYISSKAAGSSMSEFLTQLGNAPVTAKFDRGVVARMLTEIAAADGSVGDDERAFLAAFIPPDLGTVDDLLRASKVSPAELAETSTGAVRDTMLMLAWAVAYTDEELAPEEAARLEEFASGLAIDGARVAALKSYAQHYLLDQSLQRAYASGQRDAAVHAEAMAMAQRLGIDATEAERADIRFRKRYGLV